MIQGTRIWDVTRITDRETVRVELSDLVRFKGHWYCGFREAEIHGSHPSGRGRIIRSADGEAWETAALFDWDAADVREPKFSVTAEGMLMVNTSMPFCSREARPDGRYYLLGVRGVPASDREPDVARQSVTWLSADGVTWSAAYACPSGVNTWRWEVEWHNGMGYSVGYCGKDARGTLYRTRDGKSWRVLKEDFFPSGRGNEASLAFGLDDTAYCLLRAGGPVPKAPVPPGACPPAIGIGKPPYYQEWEWREVTVDWEGDVRPAAELLRAPFGGPRLMRASDGRFFAVGRVLGPGRDTGHITLFHVDPERARLTYVEEFTGTTYGGIAEHDGALWASHCSSDVSAVYLARVEMPA